MRRLGRHGLAAAGEAGYGWSALPYAGRPRSVFPPALPHRRLLAHVWPASLPPINVRGVLRLLASDLSFIQKVGLPMSNTPHTLAEEFPGQMEAIHNLKVSDAHFARLLREYDDVNDQIHRAETRIAPVDELAENQLRKKRLQIKDAITHTLNR